MKAKNIFIILILAAVLYVLYKRVISKKGDGGTSEGSGSSYQPGTYQEIPTDALYADYKDDLEVYVNRLNVDEAWRLTKSYYPTEVSFKNKIKSWVKTIWLSAKNNTKWTQAGVIQAAQKSGVTYNQQIVKDAIWQMGQQEKGKITGNGATQKKAAIHAAFDELLSAVENM